LPCGGPYTPRRRLSSLPSMMSWCGVDKCGKVWGRMWERGGDGRGLKTKRLLPARWGWEGPRGHALAPRGATLLSSGLLPRSGAMLIVCGPNTIVLLAPTPPTLNPNRQTDANCTNPRSQHPNPCPHLRHVCRCLRAERHEHAGVGLGQAALQVLLHVHRLASA
jgi:hypothetical protein